MTNGVADDESEDILVEFLRTHLRAILKAPLIGLMALFSIYVITGSAYKGLLVGSICCCVSFFTTWRRFLEPLSFAAFCLAVAVMCDHELGALMGSVATAWAHVMSR